MVGGSLSTQREPTHTRGEHANATQKGPSRELLYIYKEPTKVSFSTSYLYHFNLNVMLLLRFQTLLQLLARPAERRRTSETLRLLNNCTIIVGTILIVSSRLTALKVKVYSSAWYTMVICRSKIAFLLKLNYKFIIRV